VVRTAARAASGRAVPAGRTAAVGSVIPALPSPAKPDCGWGVSDARGGPGGVVTVEVRTRQAVTLGSTDLMLRYDRRSLEAVSADSASLSGFTFGIDARWGLVRTASATGEQDVLPAGATLLKRPVNRHRVGPVGEFACKRRKHALGAVQVSGAPTGRHKPVSPRRRALGQVQRGPTPGPQTPKLCVLP
jgi:hypothetical protein